jgi:Flp pilus assembly protein TadD
MQPQQPPSGPPAAGGRAKRLWAAAGLVGLLAALGLGAWGALHWWRGPPPTPGPTQEAAAPAEGDPRLTFDTPYRNVRPEVRYVGDGACAECHERKAESYHHHPMGRSTAPAAAVSPPEPTGAAAHNPFSAVGLRFEVERRGPHVFHKEQLPRPEGGVLAAVEAEVGFAIGSGARGRSYVVERDGYLFQSPISWFSQRGLWDVSPGYEAGVHFNRLIRPGCLFCHANQATPVEHTLNRYETPVLVDPAIGCERCHGPGELHVRERRGGARPDGTDTSIVNPRDLPPALRESVCDQCHLQGETRVVRRGRQPFDFRPGLPLRLFWSVFVRPPALTDNAKSVSQTEQMSVSRCFQGSLGKLGCISCHDPHSLPPAEKRVTFYRNRCQRCHEKDAPRCSQPPERRHERQPDDSCVACHMPPIATSDIAHTALTDHRILRRPDDEAPAPPPGAGAGEMRLVYFRRGERVNLREPALARDNGVALMQLARQPMPAALHRRFSQEALPLLRTALDDWPGDVPAREAEALALRLQGRSEEALSACEAVLARAPGRELTLSDAASIAEQLGRRRAAIDYLRRAAAVNPWHPEYRASLARLLAEDEEWAAAVPECEAALRLAPTDGATRQVLIRCCLRAGDKERAAREFDDLLTLQPRGAADLRRWFEEQRSGAR